MNSNLINTKTEFFLFPGFYNREKKTCLQYEEIVKRK